MNANTPDNPPLRLYSAFYDLFPEQQPDALVQGPGREMWVAALRSDDATYTLHAPDIGAKTQFSRRSAISRRTVLNRPLPNWARYPAGVVIALSDAGLDVPGLRAVFVGDEARGPRYDYALGVTLAALWHHLTDMAYTGDKLIEITEKVRREYVGG